MDTGRIMFFEGLSFGWVVSESALNEIGAEQLKRDFLIDALFDQVTGYEERKIDEENR